MRGLRSWLIVAVAVLAIGCGKPVPQLPNVPAYVESADQDVRAGAAKALGILVAAARLANTISQIEDQAAREGVIPAAADASFDRAMVAYADASDAAVARITAGVRSWAELKAHVDPVVHRVNELSLLAAQIGVLRDRVGSWLSALKDIVLELVNGFGPAVFGGAR